MLRESEDRLSVPGAELDGLINAGSSYDFHSPDVRADLGFEPALEYVAAVGHLVRKTLEPGAWVRNLIFDFEVGTIVFSGRPSILDRLMTMIRRYPVSATVLPLTFHYDDCNRDGQSRYDHRACSYVRGERLSLLLARERTLVPVFAIHHASTIAAFGAFFRRITNLAVNVVEATYYASLYDVRYDLGLDVHRDLRHDAEIGGQLSILRRRLLADNAAVTPPHILPAMPDRWIDGSPILPAERAFDPDVDPTLFSRADLLIRLAAAHIAGDIVLFARPQDSPYPYLLLAADRRTVVPIMPEGSKFRLLGRRSTDPDEIRDLLANSAVMGPADLGL